MILHNLVQGSPAWFEWRLGGLSGTDAPVILAAHRKARGAQRALEALLGRKLAPPAPDDRYPEHFRPRGPSDSVRELARRVGWELQPACCQHDQEPWLRATLDGITWAGDAIAKCGQSNIPEHALVLEGGLPEELAPQVQHCLLASGAGLCWYVSRSEAKHFATGQRWAVVEVYEDPEFQAELLQAEEEFWRRLTLVRSGGKWVQESA